MLLADYWRTVAVRTLLAAQLRLGLLWLAALVRLERRLLLLPARSAHTVGGGNALLLHQRRLVLVLLRCLARRNMRQGLATLMRRRLLVLRRLGVSVASTGLGGLGASLGAGALGGGGHGRGALVARGLLIRVTAKDVPVVLPGSCLLYTSPSPRDRG